MHPVIRLFGYRILCYHLCAVLAGAAGALLCLRAYRRREPGAWRYLLPPLTVLFALAGARGLNYLLNPSAFDSAFPVTRPFYGRLSLVGGLSLGLAPTLLVSRVKRIPTLPLLDDLVLPAGVGIMILKLGCFLNGCCVGRHTDSAFGVVFPANELNYALLESLRLIPSRPHRVHPVQLYEIAGTALALLLTWLAGRCLRLRPGGRFGLFVLLYSAVRAAIHPLRVFPYDRQVIAVWYPLLYALLMALGALAFLLFGRPSLPSGPGGRSGRAGRGRKRKRNRDSPAGADPGSRCARSLRDRSG